MRKKSKQDINRHCFFLFLYFNIVKLIKNERGLFMKLTNKKIALLQKIINAKLTKEELNQVIDKAQSIIDRKPKIAP